VDLALERITEQHSTVGEKVEAVRLEGEFQFGLEAPVEAHALDARVVDIEKPQPAVVLARALGKFEAVSIGISVLTVWSFMIISCPVTEIR